MWTIVFKWLNSAIILIIYGATAVIGDLPQGYQNCLSAPQQFIAKDGDCFFEPQNGLDYTAAKGYCDSTHGGQLPVLIDPEKFNGVSNLLATASNQMCFLALEQSPGATLPGDGWSWKFQNTTDVPMTLLALWATGEPNNNGGQEDAAALGLSGGIRPEIFDIPRSITNPTTICQVSKGFNWCLAQQPGDKVLLSDGSCVAKHPDSSTIHKSGAKTRCGPDGQLPVLREVADRNAVAAMMGSGKKIWLGLHQEGVGATDENWYWEYRNGFRLPLLNPTWIQNQPDDLNKPVGDPDTNTQNEGLMDEFSQLLDSNPTSTPKNVYCQYFPLAIKEECSEFESWPGLKFQPGVGVPPVMTGLPGNEGLEKCVQLCLLDQNCFVVEYDKATGYCKVGEERVEEADGTKFQEKGPGDTMKVYQLGKS